MPLFLKSRLIFSIPLLTTLVLTGILPIVPITETRSLENLELKTLENATSPLHQNALHLNLVSRLIGGAYPAQKAALKDGPPSPPTTSPPPGRRQPGGSLSDEPTACSDGGEEKLTAIAPVDVQGQTISEQPTFWFYVPYSPENVTVGRFSLQTQDARQNIYQGYFHLPKTPGFVSIQLPVSAGRQLQESAFYPWYLTLYCGESLDETELTADDVEAMIDTSESVFINGWVQRVEPTPERHNLVLSGADTIWYDAIAHLAQELKEPSQDTHDNQTVQTRWDTLLEGVELDGLADEPIVGPVVWIDAD
ncbi:MAG: DUF928 domain-containing protein [Leptolyngbyaceae bacterium]|nr:DUF928 domain-containing protein [Leptolyngbyaceae bacterium]